MANPIWTTGQGQRLVNLGTVTEGSYFEYPINAYDPNGGNVTYKFLAGKLPPGIRINPAGLIQGGPYLNTTTNESSAYEFTVRAADVHGLISDKSFAMAIANVNPPVIKPRTSDLGEVFDGSFFSLQLQATELNPYAALTWTVDSGTLPTGLTLSPSGLLSGFLQPLPTFGNGGLQGFNANPFNEFAFENSPTYQTNTYKFTIKVFDGVNYDSLTYQLKVLAKDLYSADNTKTSIDDVYLTIDQNNTYVPVMLTPSQSLPEVRSNSKFAFKFEGLDPNGNDLSYALSLSSGGAAGFDQSGTQGFDTVGFDQENLSVPPGLLIDAHTGWFSGTVGAQTQAVQEYSFQVFCYETTNQTVQSDPITYNMTILGDITNTIDWVTQSNLGVMDNGAISELSVAAVNNSGRALSYSLVSDGSNLPQGLQLRSSGLIVGRAAFEFFTLDNGETTIDTKISDFDNTHNFTVQASTTDGTASSQKTFTILINNYNLTPYENVYLKALPSLDQRNTFLSIVNNNDIFPESLIYRPTDPNFGRARDIRSLFLAGLNPTAVSEYLDAMGTNTYNKRVEFSNIKTAIAVDSTFNVKYEVVYIELKDQAAYKGKTPANSRLDTIINQITYPNSFANMSGVILDATGYANAGAIPEWMTSPQSDKKQLGFTRAIVLAYTVPGASKLIAYRLAANGIVFNNINFVVDRYDLDNSYTANFDTETMKFELGRETTFDRIIRPGQIATSVSYAVSGLAFNMINNQTVEYINSLGGIDGVKDYVSGDTLVFLQQEGYENETGLYDGWYDTSIIPGWTEFNHGARYNDGSSGFPANPVVGQVALVNTTYFMFTVDYDQSGNIVDTVWKTANLRGNAWTINITNGVVSLTPKILLRSVGVGTNIVQVPSMIMPSDRVQVNYGVYHSETIVYYNPVLAPGNSVPAFSTIPTLLAAAGSNTRFDGYGTRFINNRVTYGDPEAGDVWLKFPNEGPLQ